MSDIDTIIDTVTPAEATTEICIRGDLLAKADDLHRALDEHAEWEPSHLSGPDPRAPLREQLKQLHDEMRASTVRFRFRTLNDKEASDLLAKHPSPKDDKGLERYDWDPQTYPAALVAACALEPVMSEEQAGRLFDRLNLTQRNELFGTAWRANNREVDIPFFEAASAPAANTEQS
jgi:hypothetical protein